MSELPHLEALHMVIITVGDGHVLLDMHPTLHGQVLAGGLVTANKVKGAAVYGHVGADTKLPPCQVTTVGQSDLGESVKGSLYYC